MWEGNEEFNRKCGEILGISLNVEQGIEHFISAYCGYCGSYIETVNGIPTVFQTQATKENIHRIQRLIQPRLDFGKKIEIFEDICRAEKVNGEKQKSILNKIKRIQSVRNQVAHGERYSAPSLKPKLRKKRRRFLSLEDDFRTFFQEDKSSLELSDELLKELRKDQIDIVAYSYALLNELLKRRESNYFG